VKADERIRELNEETRQVRGERDAYNEEIERLKMQMDPSTLSLADIQRKLHELDPSKFREVMKDLKYDGDEPDWAKLDFMERMKIGNSQQVDENDANSMKREIERLKVKRRDLAAELEKVQNLLKMQVDIDKEQAKIYQQEIDQLKAQIASDNRRVNELNQLIT
jgi:chromosome segregation ATPase